MLKTQTDSDLADLKDFAAHLDRFLQAGAIDQDFQGYIYQRVNQAAVRHRLSLKYGPVVHTANTQDHHGIPDEVICDKRERLARRYREKLEEAGVVAPGETGVRGDGDALEHKRASAYQELGRLVFDLMCEIVRDYLRTKHGLRLKDEEKQGKRQPISLDALELELGTYPQSIARSLEVPDTWVASTQQLLDVLEAMEEIKSLGGDDARNIGYLDRLRAGESPAQIARSESERQGVDRSTIYHRIANAKQKVVQRVNRPTDA